MLSLPFYFDGSGFTGGYVGELFIWFQLSCFIFVHLFSNPKMGGIVSKRNVEGSFKFSNTKELVDEKMMCRPVFDEVIKGIASNVKMGPFTATSGVILPCMLYVIVRNSHVSLKFVFTMVAFIP